MVALHVYFVLLVVSVDTAHGEIPNEIRQFVLSLLKEHDGEVIELKQEILTLRHILTSELLLKGLTRTRWYTAEGRRGSVGSYGNQNGRQNSEASYQESIPSERDKIQCFSEFNCMVTNYCHKTLKHTRKGRYISCNRIPYDVLSVKIYMYMIKKSYFRIQYTYILNPILKLQQLFTFSNFM